MQEVKLQFAKHRNKSFLFYEENQVSLYVRVHPSTQVYARNRQRQPTAFLLNYTLISCYNTANLWTDTQTSLHSRYSDSLRAGRSGDRILVGARFSTPVQTGSGSTQTPIRVPDYSRGLSGRGVALITHTHLAPRLKKKYNYTSTPLMAFVACSSVNFTFHLHPYFIFNVVPLYY